MTPAKFYLFLVFISFCFFNFRLCKIFCSFLALESLYFFNFGHCKYKFIRIINEKIEILKGLKLKRHKLIWTKNKQKKLTETKI